MENAFKRKFGNPLVNYLGRYKEARHFFRDPIFIGGCGRSGTTLLLSILSAHPHVFAFPDELSAVVKWNPSPDDPSRQIPARLDRLYRDLLLRKVPAARQRWCEKTPRNVRYIDKILSYWPQAHFLHIVRDPRDVLTSRHPSKPGQYWVTPERWVKDVRAGLAHQDNPRVFTLRYEELVSNFEHLLSEICLFLEEPVVPQIQNWHSHTTVTRNRAWSNPVNPLHAESIRKWEQPEHAARLATILEFPGLVELMNKIGYKS